MDYPLSVQNSGNSCFHLDPHDCRCSLEQFWHWVKSSATGHPRGDLEVVWTCPMIRCRRPFPGQTAMLQHLRECWGLTTTVFWCQECLAIESFTHTRCRACPSQVCRTESFGSTARHYFDSMGSASNLDFTRRESSMSEKERTRIHSSSFSDPSARYSPKDGSMGSTCCANENSPISNLTLDPYLDPRLQLVQTQSSHCLSVPPSSGSVRSSSEFASRSRSQSPFLRTPILPTTLIPDQKYQSDSASTSASADSWDDMYRSNRTENLFTKDDLVSVSSPLPDQLPTPKSLPVAFLDSIVSASAKSTKPSGDMFLDLDNSLCEEKASGNSSFVRDNDLAIYELRFRSEGARFENLSLAANLALTDEVDMSFGLSTFDTQQSAAGVEQRWRGSPQSLLRTTWSMLQVHIESSLRKLGVVGQSLLASHFAAMSTVDVVDRGLAASLEIWAGGECRSPLDLICLTHFSHAMSLALNTGGDREASRGFFAQAMSYSEWVERHDRETYINMVDALWRPTHMTLSDVVGLLQGNAWSLSGQGSSSSSNPAPSSGTRASDPIVKVFELFIDEFEHAVLEYSPGTNLESSNLYIRHLKDFETEIHRSQAFILATTLLLRVLAQQFIDVPRLANGIADMLNRVSSAHFTTARRVELEVLTIGRCHLSTSRFLVDYVPIVRAQVDSLYARNPNTDSQRQSYRQDSGMLVMSLFRAISQDMQVGRPLSLMTDISSGLQSVDDFMGSMTSDIGDLGFQDNTSQYRAPNPSHAGMTIQHDTGVQMDPSLVVGSALSTSGAVATPSPTGSHQASTASADTSSGSKIESNTTCSLCGYRPKGDPRWFSGSMAKHMKLQHATTPPKIYRCPYPGCTSQFQKRPDNLRQHQIEKGHFVESQGESSKRVSKRKKT